MEGPGLGPADGSTLLIGGARSGKSDIGQQFVAAAGGAVSVVVTAEAGDDEMTDRIARHRRDRPPDWRTIEAPRRLAEAVAEAPSDHAVLLDCVSFWIANLVLDGADEPEMEARAVELGDAVAARRAPVVVVGNEVGQGIVPADPVSRRFRDANGRANRLLAERVDRSYFVVAGRLLSLTGVAPVLSR